MDAIDDGIVVCTCLSNAKRWLYAGMKLSRHETNEMLDVCLSISELQRET